MLMDALVGVALFAVLGLAVLALLSGSVRTIGRLDAELRSSLETLGEAQRSLSRP
jgi:hypothetical protein